MMRKIILSLCLFWSVSSGCDNSPAEPNPNDRWLPENYRIMSIESDKREVTVKLECVFPKPCFEYVKNETYKLGQDIFVNVYFKKNGDDSDTLVCPDIQTTFITNPIIRVANSGVYNFKFVKNSAYSVDTTFAVP